MPINNDSKGFAKRSDGLGVPGATFSGDGGDVGGGCMGACACAHEMCYQRHSGKLGELSYSGSHTSMSSCALMGCALMGCALVGCSIKFGTAVPTS
eukprot:933101-Pelagomonas_calceolata.AAC.2